MCKLNSEVFQSKSMEKSKVKETPKNEDGTPKFNANGNISTKYQFTVNSKQVK